MTYCTHTHTVGKGTVLEPLSLLFATMQMQSRKILPPKYLAETQIERGFFVPCSEETHKNLQSG